MTSANVPSGSLSGRCFLSRNKEPATLMENKVTARNPITEGCIWKGMLLFALPIMLGSLLQQLYNTADAVIVGRALGKAALASVGGSSGRITNLLVNAFVALSSGASVIVAQHFGARDTQRVRRSICTAMLLSVVCGILLTVIGITSARQLLVWMQTTPETLDASAAYLRIFFLGMVPTMLYNMGSGILRAMGDSKRPLYYLFVCVVANIALDLLFVIVFQWGIEGAAAATALSQVVCAALVVRALRRLPEEQRLLYDREELDRGILRRMLRVGIPPPFKARCTALPTSSCRSASICSARTPWRAGPPSTSSTTTTGPSPTPSASPS